MAFSPLTWLGTVWKAAGAALRRGRSRGESALAALFTGGGFPYGGQWQGKKLEQVQRYRTWPYIAIRAKAVGVARHEPQVAHVRPPEEADRTTNKRLLPTHLRTKALTHVQQHEELEAVDSDHPLLRLLHNPNGPDTSFTFLFRMVMFLELTGECYVWKVRNRAGLPTELWLLFPQWVTPRRGIDRLVDAYEVRPWGGDAGGGRMFEVAPEDMIFLCHPSPVSMLSGWSPLQAASEWFDAAGAIDRSRWHLFENGAFPGLVVGLDAAIMGPTVSPAEIERVKARFRQLYQGTDKYGELMILNPGMKVEKAAFTAPEAGYLESSDQLRDSQLALYGVSKFVAGISDDVNRATALAALERFSYGTLAPLLIYLGQALTEGLAREYDDDLVIYWPDMRPDDPEQRNADIDLQLKAFAISPNEVRQAFGREPFPHGGDNPVGPGGMELPWVDPAAALAAQGGADEFAGPGDGGGEGEEGEEDEFELNGVGKAFDPGKHPRGQPENRGQFGSGGGGGGSGRGRSSSTAGGSKKPTAEGDPAAGRPSRPEERHDVEPPILPMKPPPPSTGVVGGRKAGGFTADGLTNTAMGDLAEEATAQLGLRSILPPGLRHGKDVASEGSTLDREFDHSGYAFEVKAVSVTATEYKAKPKKAEVEGKIRYAERNGLKPAMMIAVLDHAQGEIHCYWRPGIGAYRLPADGKGWHYMGTVRASGRAAGAAKALTAVNGDT